MTGYKKLLFMALSTLTVMSLFEGLCWIVIFGGKHG